MQLLLKQKITFNDYANISSETLKEELFHAWQDAYYPGGTSQYGKNAQGNKLPGYVNVEFEAKFFKDLLDNPEIYNGCCYAFGPDALPHIYMMSTLNGYMILEIREI